jgi:hypothetical protein
LAHAILGCCAHSGHFGSCCEATEVAHTESHHDCGHHHSHEKSPAEHSCPDGDHQCCHDSCQWVANSVHLDLGDFCPFAFVSFDSVEVETDPYSLELRQRLSIAQSPPLLPVRSHLALSILLV